MLTNLIPSAFYGSHCPQVQEQNGLLDPQQWPAFQPGMVLTEIRAFSSGFFPPPSHPLTHPQGHPPPHPSRCLLTLLPTSVPAMAMAVHADTMPSM